MWKQCVCTRRGAAREAAGTLELRLRVADAPALGGQGQGARQGPGLAERKESVRDPARQQRLRNLWPMPRQRKAMSMREPSRPAGGGAARTGPNCWLSRLRAGLSPSTHILPRGTSFRPLSLRTRIQSPCRPTTRFTSGDEASSGDLGRAAPPCVSRAAAAPGEHPGNSTQRHVRARTSAPQRRRVAARGPARRRCS